MASVLIYHVVGDLTVAKPELVEFLETETVESAIKAIGESTEGGIPVWRKKSQMGMIENSEMRLQRFVGILNPLDIVAFLSKDWCLQDQEKAMKTPVSEVIVPNNSLLKEVDPATRWSKSLDFTGKFPFSRDIVVESYIWAVGVLFEPEFCYGRAILVKLFKIITVVNDIYDAYGTIQELEPFTQAILRWDNHCINQLPDYMKLIYQILLDTFQGFEQDLANGGRSCAIYDYLQKELKISCQAYLEEARWCHKKYIPQYDEYMKNGMESSVYCFMLVAVHLGMGETATKDELQWIYKNSNAVKSSCKIARLWADMGGHKFERKRKHVDSAVECYMASFDASEEEAYKELQHQVEEAWMDLKEEMLRPTAVSMRLLTPITNMCRALYDMYKIGEDAFNMPITIKDKVQALLIDPAI